MSPGEVSLILFGVFGTLVLLRIPVSFALGLACIPLFLIDVRLRPDMLLNEMWKSYNAFILLAVPFFLLAYMNCYWIKVYVNGIKFYP